VWNPSFLLVPAPCGRTLYCATLPAAARHLFGTRDANVRAESPGALGAWAAVARTLDVTADRLLRVHQVHGAGVVVCRRGSTRTAQAREPMATALGAHQAPAEADVIASDDPDVAITVRVADCAPILIADARLGAVAAAHAGWRGTSLGVAQRAVEAMVAHFGSRAGDLSAAIGPCIGPGVYEVGEQVRAAFEADGHGPAALARWFRPGRAGRPHLDVWQANTDQLVDAGVPASQVACARACTATHRDWFFSHRGEGAATGRMVAAIRAFGPAATPHGTHPR
jgi:YfiH family protein